MKQASSHFYSPKMSFRTPIVVYVLGVLLALCVNQMHAQASTLLFTQAQSVSSAEQMRIDSVRRVSADSVQTESDTSTATGLNVGSGSISLGVGAGLSTHTPFIGLSAGSEFISIPDMHSSPQMLQSIHLSYGGLRASQFIPNTDVYRANYDRLIAEYYSSSAVQTADSTLIQTRGWRVGFQLGSGYSVMRDTAEPKFSFMHNGGLSWSFNRFDAARPAQAGQNVDDVASLANAEHSYFGIHTGFTMRYDVSSSVALQLEGERTMMFQNYAFFGWLGSATCEGISQLLLGAFVINRIAPKSPHSVFYASTILRTALSFAWYELRRSKQHFPFGGNPPIVSDAIRLGFSFSL